MSTKKVCSYKNNRRAKATQFKKGNKCNTLYLPDKPVSADHTGVSDSGDINAQAMPDTCRITRPTFSVFSDACQVSSSNSNTNTVELPSKLRPAKEKELGLIHGTNVSEENIIVNINSLSKLVAGFAHTCAKQNPTVHVDKRQGLCITASTKCATCGFKSGPTKLFTSIKQSRGPDSGGLNDALVIPVLKSKMGVSDIQYVMTCLNIQPPSGTCLRSKINRAADKIESINVESMQENQRYVRTVKEMAGEEPQVNVETDASYNNRPQAGYEAATQSFCPMLEQDTTKKLVLSMQTANKLCPKRNCKHDNDKCKQNFSPAKTISSSESELTRNNLENIVNEGILNVKSVTSDASPQIEKCVKDYANEKNESIYHYKCLVHKLRTLQKQIKNVRLTSKLPGCDKSAYAAKLAIATRTRVRLELVRIKKRYPSTADFITESDASIKNIIPCFSGNHENCRVHSLVCTAHLESYSPNFLPYCKHIQFNDADSCQMKAILQKYFSRQNLEKISRLSTTNQSESLHHRVFTYAPKSTIWSRNFSGLCHSAVHSATFGTGKSSLIIASAIGIKYKLTDPICRQMLRIDAKTSYHSLRKRSRQYKISRYLSRKRKCCKKLQENSMYQNASKEMSHEHAYGFNMNK